jgi:glycolate oxidase
MDGRTRETIKAIAGPGNFLEDPEDLAVYTYDATPLPGKTPALVVLPTSSAMLAAIMKVASESAVPVIPRGAASGLAGGFVPAAGGALVVDMHHMNQIIEIDKANMTVTAQAGVVTQALQDAVNRAGLLYPPDPASMAISTIGGNIATNAGGPRGVKYGNTLQYVLGLEVVLADGRILKTGSKCIKQASGYNLTRLFVGSEGTLGIITQAILRLVPLPQAKQTLLVVFGKVAAAAQAVSDIIARGILPASIELMDRKLVNLLEQYIATGFPLDAEAILVIEADGDPDSLAKTIVAIERICADNAAVSVKAAQSDEEADRFWEARRMAFAICSRARPNCLVEDVTVPRASFPQIIEKIQQISEDNQVTTVLLAHAGDGNTHPMILTDVSDAEEMRRVNIVLEKIALEGLKLGGTLSGEHGIGTQKMLWMEQEHSPVGIDVMKAIKRALDPQGILNPGKLWGRAADADAAGGEEQA